MERASSLQLWRIRWLIGDAYTPHNKQGTNWWLWGHGGWMKIWWLRGCSGRMLVQWLYVPSARVITQELGLHGPISRSLQKRSIQMLVWGLQVLSGQMLIWRLNPYVPMYKTQGRHDGQVLIQYLQAYSGWALTQGLWIHNGWILIRGLLQTTDGF